MEELYGRNGFFSQIDVKSGSVTARSVGRRNIWEGGSDLQKLKTREERNWRKGKQAAAGPLTPKSARKEKAPSQQKERKATALQG